MWVRVPPPLLVNPRYLNIHGVIARIIINDALLDNTVLIHSEYHNRYEKPFDVGEILYTIGERGHKLDPAFKAYECNSDTFDKFLVYFKEVKGLWEVKCEGDLPPIEKWHDNFGE